MVAYMKDVNKQPTLCNHHLMHNLESMDWDVKVTDVPTSVVYTLLFNAVSIKYHKALSLFQCRPASWHNPSSGAVTGIHPRLSNHLTGVTLVWGSIFLWFLLWLIHSYRDSNNLVIFYNDGLIPPPPSHFSLNIHKAYCQQ